MAEPNSPAYQVRPYLMRISQTSVFPAFSSRAVKQIEGDRGVQC